MALTINVYPHYNPRIIEVTSPQEEASLQDIVNEIRAWEDSDIGQHYPALIDAAGKESLGGGVLVGITATLLNAQIMFTPRTVPLDDGVGRTCDLTDSTGESLYVNDADFITDGVFRGCTVKNLTTGEQSTVLAVVDQYTLEMLPLSGFGGTGWTSGDSYIVYNNVQCKIEGGNLVAEDEFGAEMSATLQSVNTQIERTSSSSATLQELKAIEFASFQNAVCIDVANTTGKAVSGTGGSGNLVGTRAIPSNNLADTHLISDDRGLNRITVLGDLTLTNVADWSGHEFIGESAIRTTITVEPTANVLNCEFYDCSIEGTLDGNSLIERSVLKNLNYVEGFVHKCSIQSAATISLGTGTIANILSCYSGQPGPTTPTIDMGGTGILSLRDYFGGIRLENYSGTAAHSIDLSSGQVILDSTSIVSGIFVVRGVGKLVDESGNEIETGTWNGGVTIVNELVQAKVQEAIDAARFAGQVSA